jgi:hypothetical protein
MGKETTMNRPFAVSVLAATVLMLANAAPAMAQQQAGVSAAVRGQVALSRASQNIVGKKVGSGEAIFLGDAITSGKNSGMQVMLLDETIFTIGPNSAMSIDEFVYDPSTNAGKVAASVTKGVFRFITGKIARKRPEDMTVRLPTATIGIRGTIVAGAVRSGAGDAAVDKLFDGLRGKAPGAENARDFVVLLGPGNENNTNDKGGEFVFTPGGVQQAATGGNAGSLLAQVAGVGGSGGDAVTVSRTGWGAASDATGQIFGPFTIPVALTQGLTSPLSTQPASGPSGKPEDPKAAGAKAFDGKTANRVSGQVVAGTLQGLLGTRNTDDVDRPIFDNPPVGTEPVTVAAVRANFSGSTLAQASFNVNQNGLSFSSVFQLNLSSDTYNVDLNSITTADGGSFGNAFASGNLSELPFGLAADGGPPDSVTAGSSGSCADCTIFGAMFTVNTVTIGLTFDNGGASLGSAQNGVSAAGTGSVIGN